MQDLTEALMVQIKFEIFNHVLNAEQRLVLYSLLECILYVPKHHVPQHFFVATNLHKQLLEPFNVIFLNILDEGLTLHHETHESFLILRFKCLQLLPKQLRQK